MGAAMCFLLKQVLIIATFLLFRSSARHFPSYLTVCHYNDPNINECMKTQIGIIQKHLKDGVPELKIPPANPFRVNEITLSRGPSFTAVFTDVDIYDADGFVIHHYNLDLPNNRLEVNASFPQLRAKCNYKIDGKILFLNLNGSGAAEANATNLKASTKAEGTRYTKNGKEYLKFDRHSMTLDIGKSSLHFDRLFGDNEELNKQTDKIVNENIKAILEEANPLLSDAIETFSYAVWNNILGMFPLDELFPQ